MPVADPWLTAGWTNQANTGDIEQGSGSSSGGLLSPNEPVLQNLQAESFDTTNLVTSSALASGSVYLIKIYLPIQFVVTNVSVFSVAAGTSSAFYTGLYAPSGSRLSTSADLHASLGTNTFVTGAQTSTTIVGPGLIYAGIINVTGTTTTLSAASASLSVTANTNLTAPTSGQPFTNASLRWAIGATGQTSLPTSVTPSSATGTGALSLWVALS